MAYLRRGAAAGLLAGFVVALLFFVDYGPGTNLSTIAHWFALSGSSLDKLVGFVLLLAVGTLFGLVFGAVCGRRRLTMSQSVLAGLLTGVVWWVVIVWLLGTIIRHGQQSLYGVMLFLMSSLLYGLVLGSLYGRWSG